MASPNQLPAGVDVLLTSDEGSDKFRDKIKIVSEQLEGGQLTILDLVKALADVLTSTIDATRKQGALLLAEVIEASPAAVQSSQDAHHLAVFFASRISDWPSLRPALKGCLALVQQREQPATQCAPADAVEMARALLEVNVRSLTVGDRQLSLQLLLALIEGYGSVLVEASLQLLEGAAAALDGERDPRCLLAGFQAIASLAKLYSDSGEAPAKVLEEHAEELVDVLGCYFPIVYTPPADTRGKVTRKELVTGVESALSAAPALAPHALPMVLEKLSSSLRQAQEDALSALVACTKGYGTAAMEQHLPKIWAALRGILTAPSDMDLASEDKLKAQELAGKAQECLRECASSLGAEGSVRLVDLVLDDGIVRDLLDDVADPAQRGGFAGASRRSQAALPVLAAVAESSCVGSDRVCERLLGSLIRLTEAAQSSDSRRLGLEALLCLVSATRRCVAEAHHPQDSTGTADASAWPVSIDGVSGASALSQLGSAAETGRDGASLLAGKGADILRLALREAARDMQASRRSEGVDMRRAGEEEALSKEFENQAGEQKAPEQAELQEDKEADIIMLRLQILAELATFPQSSSPLPHADQELALDRLVSYACAPAPPKVSGLQDGDASTDSDQDPVGSLVCSALEGMARAGYAELLNAAALPSLFAVAGLPAPVSGPNAEAALQSSTPGLPAEQTGVGTAEHSSGRGVAAAASGEAAISGRRGEVALQALASIARASSQLRAPVLAAFVAGIPAALRAAATGGGSIGSPLLTTLSDERLLAGDAKAAESVALKLLKGIPALSEAHSSISGAALRDAATLAQAASSICSGTQDASFARVACRMVMSGACSLPTRPHAEIAQEVALAAAALAVLPPSFAAEEQRLQVLRALLDLALGIQDGFTAAAVAACAASLVNKAPKDEVDRAVALALDDTLLPLVAGQESGSKRALLCLGQLSKAMVMRGHARFQDILEAAMKLAHELTATQPAFMELTPHPQSAGEADSCATASDAAQVFAALVDTNQSQALNRPLQIFGKGRVLWQQRAFSVAVDLLLQEFQGALKRGDAAPSKGVIYCLERLLSAAGRDAPAAVRAGYERVLPAALTSLAALSGSGDVSDDDAADALLQQLQQALSTPQGQAVLEGELDRLIPLCAKRSLGAARAAHRAQAVAALETVTAYPYRLLHPFKAQVMAALSKAVDDRKRAVRAAAVRCRRRWGAQPL